MQPEQAVSVMVVIGAKGTQQVGQEQAVETPQAEQAASQLVPAQSPAGAPWQHVVPASLTAGFSWEAGVAQRSAVTQLVQAEICASACSKGSKGCSQGLREWGPSTGSRSQATSSGSARRCQHSE